MMSDTEGRPTISEIFPAGGRLLLTGGGKDFIERVGVEATRQAVHNVMMGGNLRTETEPLSRRRIGQVSGAMVALFTDGFLQMPDFSERLSEMALQQIAASKKNDKASTWPAQWLIGMTDKGVQNILRNDPSARQAYINDFEAAVSESAEKCRQEMGDLRMTLGYLEKQDGRRVDLDWTAITRLTTAIGSLTLTLRGSEKSVYGKLFERLVMGSFLTIMGFKRVNPVTNKRTKDVFWLSDSSDTRESDATVLLKPGTLARFDIGFIGPGNPEISKDKLSRYAREVEMASGLHNSVTFIVVDRLPKTGNTEDAASKIGAEIIQMSMQYWPRLLAGRLHERLGYEHELRTMPDREISGYLQRRLADIAIQDFLIGVSAADLDAAVELSDAGEEQTPSEE